MGTGTGRLAQVTRQLRARPSLRQVQLALARLSWGRGGCRAPACGCGGRTLSFCAALMGN
jgi:hypothetical protein